MTYLCLVIDFHQPIRLNRFFPYERISRFAEGASVISGYLDEKLNQEAFTKAYKDCYSPLLRLLYKSAYEARESSNCLRVALNFSGTFLQQAIRYSGETVDSVKQLLGLRLVELLGTPYYHSLASLYPDGASEFKEHIQEHRISIQRLFGVEPKFLMNTDMLYSDRVSQTALELGFEGVIIDGCEKILEERSPNRVYSYKSKKPKILSRHTSLSDDLRHRFSNQSWSEYPLTAEKFVAWLSANPWDVITLVVDAETFGIRHRGDTDIFRFLEHLTHQVSAHPNLRWATPTEVAQKVPDAGVLTVPEPNACSRYGVVQGSSAWLGNSMQRICFDRVAALTPYVKEIGNSGVTNVWRILQQSDHLLWMSTDAQILEDTGCSSPFSSPPEAFAVYESVLSDFEGKLGTLIQKIRSSKANPPSLQQKTQPPPHPTTTLNPSRGSHPVY